MALVTRDIHLMHPRPSREAMVEAATQSLFHHLRAMQPGDRIEVERCAADGVNPVWRITFDDGESEGT